MILFYYWMIFDDYMRGFPLHPHRGIKTITYMLNGEVEHRDSLRNNGVIGSGDVHGTRGSVLDEYTGAEYYDISIPLIPSGRTSVRIQNGLPAIT